MPTRPEPNHLAKHVTVSNTHLTIELQDGRIISQPLAWTPGLVGATQAQRSQFRLLGRGSAVVWDALDEDVCVELMLWPRSSACCCSGTCQANRTRPQNTQSPSPNRRTR